MADYVWKLVCSDCGRTLAITRRDALEPRVEAMRGRGVEVTGPPQDPANVVCLECQAIDAEQFDTTIAGNSPALRRIHNADPATARAARADLRARFNTAVATELRDVDLAALTADQKFAAVTKAVGRVDIEMLAELSCIEVGLGPLPPPPQHDD